MPNSDNLLEAISKLNQDGELTSEVTGTLSLAALGDMLVVVREIKNDNVEIKGNVAILVEKQGKNEAEINLLRKKSWAADAITAGLAAFGIILGAQK